MFSTSIKSTLSLTRFSLPGRSRKRAKTSSWTAWTSWRSSSRRWEWFTRLERAGRTGGTEFGWLGGTSCGRTIVIPRRGGSEGADGRKRRPQAGLGRKETIFDDIFTRIHFLKSVCRTSTSKSKHRRRDSSLTKTRRSPRGTSSSSPLTHHSLLSPFALASLANGRSR